MASIISDTPSNAVSIDKNNPAITRIDDKCINCGVCTQTCVIREGMYFRENTDLCVYCGQCVQTCPTRAIVPKMEYSLFEEAKAGGKICIAYTSPAVRVALGEAFGIDDGRFLEGKLVGLLKMLGFDYVFDTTYGADLTIMEEVSELLDRIGKNKKLPMFTSCCPAWVKYACQFHPKLIDNISSCKSPIGMMGEVVSKYISNNDDIDSGNVYTVAITPCTAKKYEIKRDKDSKTNLVLTINELSNIIRDKNVKYEDIPEVEFDSIFKGSGSGLIFGNTGGVMEAAIRTCYYLVNGKNISDSDISFNNVRGYDGVREAIIDISDDIKLNVCIIHGISNARDILNEIEKGNSKYHFVEVMNCLGGCIGGGGQVKTATFDNDEIKNMRIESLYNHDKEMKIRYCHDNPNIDIVYSKFFTNDDIRYDRLHTGYEDISYLDDMDDMIREKSCGAIIYKYINDDMYILLLKHREGHYSFAKGHVEDGESEEETALREIKEETNLDVKLDTSFREVITYNPKPYVVKDVIYFMAEACSDDIKPQLSEISDARWYSIEEAKNLITYDNDRELFSRFIMYMKNNV